MQEDVHIFQGLRRDNHQIRQKAEYLWDAHNIRLTNREDSTLLSITNEKGTLDTGVTFQGFYVGHCVLGKYLVVFTASKNGKNNFIYRVEKVNNGYTVIILYQDDNPEKGWSPSNPIETLGCYENGLVQKVYWIDGVNQPRVMNITQPEVSVPDEFHSTVIVNGTNFSLPSQSLSTEAKEKLLELYPNGIWTKGSNSFDFVQKLKLNETITIEKSFSGGSFSPGTIQYAFTYFNRYGQESKVFYTTGLYYISHDDRGGNPEERVPNQFKIVVSNCDDFNYVRIYSIHRTSIDAVPTVKQVSDVRIIGGTATYTDLGTTGVTVDLSKLLYIGGTSIVPSSMAAKDGTLFFGGISVESQNQFSEVRDLIEGASIPKSDCVIDSFDRDFVKGQYYSYSQRGALSSYVAGFKSRERYRCGIQVQTEDGEWSSPIHLEDCVLNDEFPSSDDVIKLHSKKWTLNQRLVQDLYNKGVRRIRPCVVFPTILDYDILCQGVLCPTVYNVNCRKTDSPYAQSSWFFRPLVESLVNTANVQEGAKIEFRHNRPLLYGGNRGAEVQNMQKSSIKTINDISTLADSETYKSYFFVDSNIVTFHSPDLEFNDSIKLTDWDNTELVILGTALIGATAGDIDIQTSTPTFDSSASGFNKFAVGYTMRDDLISFGGGLISGAFYEDGKVYNNFSGSVLLTKFLVYPWHRSGSLNNDSARPTDKGTRSAVLSKKKLSNLRFSYRTFNEAGELHYDISTPQLFDSNEVSLLKVRVPYLGKAVSYYGNVDYMVTSGGDYDIYSAGSFSGSLTPLSEDESSIVIKTSKDPVRIKYKSSPHLVFSLDSGDSSKISILPRRTMDPDGTNLDGETYVIPDWSYIEPTDPDNPDNPDNPNNPPADALLLGYITNESPMLMRDIPSSRIGQYIYTYSNTLDPREPRTIWQMQLYQGSVDVMYVNNLDGSVFKVEKGITVIKGAQDSIFSSLPVDSNNVYTGETKYFVATKTGVGLGDGSAHVYSFSEYSSSRASRAASRRGQSLTISQKSFGSTAGIYPSCLLFGELRRKVPVPNNVKFGGDTEEAKRENLWIPASEAVLITPGSAADITFKWGDTWYSRYDCLKTYPFTQEDENSVVEIGSFMCETRTNIDGRYDRNRGQLSNINMTPQNFNLMNPIYDQKDNIFNYRMLEEDYYRNSEYANQITWSLEKTPASDTDPWTNITLANVLDMDGSKGRVTSLRVFNDTLVCFQEKAINQILFNSRVQIPTSDGVPVEISNGYKVDGSRFISDSVGCQNKWATTTTTTGIYFIDNYTNTIWLYNGQLNNISEALGMKWWVQNNHTDKEWRPLDQGTHIVNGVRAFYDPLYRDIYFTPGPDTEGERDALCYSEQLGQFTSQMSYGGTQAMFQFGDGFFSLRHKGSDLQLYENFKGNYNNFFGTTKGWDFSFISNDNPLYTKIFDTVELRADHWMTYGSTKLLNTFPMNYIEVENEYQKAKATVDSKNTKKKFRVWRAFIPRSSTVSERGTDITRQYGRARIRNPWAMIKMGWKPEGVLLINNTKKAMIHDVSVKYTI